ncbi:MAG: hypothetical protein GC136_09500 [Alphaproteobacteria bacterium]|nr:hypothetical protein [Alphaproteobacteria bacterium]
MGFHRFLRTILMLLMLTPSMVCFMAVCPGVANAAVENPAPPCHGMNKETESSSGIMLMEDCMQNDLGQASAFDMPLPHIVWVLVAFILPVVAFNFPAFANIRLSGGDPPPKGRASFHRILITQRILQ